MRTGDGKGREGKSKGKGNGGRRFFKVRKKGKKGYAADGHDA